MTTVAVRGEAVREVDPDLAEFTVVVSARDRDRDTTLARLRERADGLRQLLERFGEAVQERETGALHVYPEGAGKRGERVSAYNGSVSITVRVRDFAELGELMLAVAGQELALVRGPVWSVRPDSQVHREARRGAVQNAIARAREYAEALGAEVVELVELADPGLGRAEGVPPFAQNYGSGFLKSKPSGGGYADLDLDPPRQRVSAQVEARFTITAPVL
jgi:uncharacterized protein YggE